MSEIKSKPTEYYATPEPLSELETTFYKLQEFQLEQSVIELGVDQYIDIEQTPGVDVGTFARYAFGRDEDDLKQLMKTRKCLQELKIMKSIDYSNCYTSYRNLRFNLFEAAKYAETFSNTSHHV